jgi:hypothetical protein
LCQLYAVHEAVYARYSVEIKAHCEKKTDRVGKNHVCISLHGGLTRCTKVGCKINDDLKLKASSKKV